MSAIKPLQTICSAPKCRRRQVVPANRIWHVDVRKGPGSHREAGWACRACGQENTTPPAYLPKGTIALLPSKTQVMDAVRAEQEARAVAEAERAQRQAAPHGASARPAPVARTGETRPAAIISAVAPVAARLAPAERRDESRGSSDPVWCTGAPAKAVLVEALRRISHHGGDAMAVSDGRRGFEGVDVSLPDDDADDAHVARIADVVLRELDEMRADVLVLGGCVDGRPWQAVLHYRAGAASFT